MRGAPVKARAWPQRERVPDDSFFTLFGTFRVTESIVLGQAFVRGRREGAWEAAHAERMRAVLPHLCRMARMRCLLREARTVHEDLRAALDAMSTAVALLDEAGRVLELNVAARQSLESAGAAIRRGRISPASASERRALDEATSKAALLAKASCDAGTLLPLPVAVSRRERAPLSLLAHPIRERSAARRVSGAARVLVVIRDPEARSRLAPDVLAAVHGLTKAEAHLASALAAGHTLADFADERGCSEQTARTHLKRVLDKTRTHRQTDLVRVLLSTAALDPPPSTRP